MPLACDCYAGCWGAHSEGWPTITFNPVRRRDAFRWCVENLPYGTYVVWGDDQIRVETVADLERLARFLADVQR